MLPSLKQTAYLKGSPTQKSNTLPEMNSIAKKRRACIALPSIILLLFILVFALIAYLSLIGIPQPILRAVEDAAAKQGYYLSLEKARISYFTGFGIRLNGLKIYDDENHQSEAIIEIPNCNLRISATSLLRAEFKPYSIEIRDTSINIPLTAQRAKQLKLTALNVDIELNRKGKVSISLQDAKLNGISINLRADILLTDQHPLVRMNYNQASNQPILGKFDLKEILTEQSEYIQQCYTIIEEQKWQENQFPQLYINLRYDKNMQCSMRAIIPSYKYKKYHIEKAQLEIDYRTNIIIINRLTARSINPVGGLYLQGGYDILKRQLSLNIKSDLPLLAFLGQHMGEDDKQLFQQVQHGSHAKSSFQMSGDIFFTEEYKIDKISLIGKIDQKNIQIGVHDIDQVVLSFYYNEGSFAFDEIHIQLDDSYIRATASLHEDIGSFDLIVDMYPNIALDIANEFIKSDKILQLPKDLHLDGKLNFQLKANLCSLAFKPGMIALINSIPNFESIHLNGSIPRLIYKDQYFHEPRFSLQLDSLQSELNKLPHAIGNIKAVINAKEIKLFHKDMNNITAKYAEFSVELHDSHIGKNFDLKNLIIEKAQAQLSVKELAINENKIKNIHIQLNEALNIHPFSEDKKYLKSAHADIKIKQCLIDGKKIDLIDMGIEVQGEGKLNACLQLYLDKAHSDNLKLKANWNLNTGALHVKDITLQAPANIIPEYILVDQMEKFAISFDGKITLQGELLLLTGDKKHLSQEIILESGQFNLELPEVIRRTLVIPALQDKINTLSIKTQLSFQRDEEGDYNYEFINLDILHHSGALNLQIVGNTDSYLNITGDNSIRADYIDQLLDLPSAHHIIRDFNFRPNSQCLITNLNTRINYKHGFQLEAEADIRLKHTAYQLGAYYDIYDQEDKKDRKIIKEKLRVDLGYDPFTHIKNLTAKLDLDIHYNQRDAKNKPLEDIVSIKLVDPVITYDNRPWLDKRRIKGGKEITVIRGNYVDINIGKSYVLIDDIKGEAYPGYAIGMYFAPLHGILELLDLKQPIQLSTEQCIFPIAKDCKEEMQGNIALRSEDAFNLKVSNIDFPLSNFTGIVHLADTYVLLDYLNAVLWKGVLNSKVRIDFAENNEGYDGYVNLENIEYKDLMNTFHIERTPALIQGEVRFRAKAFKLDALEAYGKISIRNGNLMELGIFSPIADLLNNIPAFLSSEKDILDQKRRGIISRSIQEIVANLSTGIFYTGELMNKTTRFIPGLNRLTQYNLQDAKANFQISNGMLTSNDLVAEGDNLHILANLSYHLKDSYINAEIWPQFSSLAQIALAPVTEISDHIIDINIYGPIDELKWKISVNNIFSMKPFSSKNKEKIKKTTSYNKAKKKLSKSKT